MTFSFSPYTTFTVHCCPAWAPSGKHDLHNDSNSISKSSPLFPALEVNCPDTVPPYSILVFLQSLSKWHTLRAFHCSDDLSACLPASLPVHTHCLLACR